MAATARRKHSRRHAEFPLRASLSGPIIETVIFVVFIGGVAWVPFWLGSNRAIPWAINAIVFAGLAALYELSLIVRGASHPVAIRSIRVSAILFALAATWALFQNATWSPAAWQHPIWQLASEALGRPIPGSISVDRDLTAIALLRLMTSASVFWLALQLGHDPSRAQFFLWSIVAIGGVYAAIGLFATGFMPNGTIFTEIGSSAHFVSSTFVNKNHYGTYAGIGFISAVAVTQQLYRRELAQTGIPLRFKIVSLLNTTAEKTALPLGITFVILAALLMTGSRGAIIATALAFLVLLVLNLRGARRFGRSELVLSVVAAAIIGVVFIGFGDRFLERIGGQGISDLDRLRAYMITIRSILSAPFLGFGYGTFMATFPMFHDSSVGLWNFLAKAHNTYLEVFQGLGLIFGTMLIVSVVLLALRCFSGATSSGDATVAIVAASISVLVGVHALVDFSLQIQAVTLTYMAVLGVGVAQTTNPTSDSA
jgi:O-antigen ligase